MLKPSGLSGGEQLRALRQRAGKTQLVVELEAGLGSGYLQRVESGKVAQPEKKTLERILSAVEASYRARTDVLELFGYIASKPLPTGREIAWACRTCQQELEAVLFPAYLLDCGHRLLAWNRLVPALFGLARDAPELLKLKHRSLIDAWFDPCSLLHPLVEEPETFFPQMIRALLHEMQPFRHEQWCLQLFNHWLRKYPLFRTYWPRAAHERLGAVAARSMTYWKLKAPGGGSLQFRLTVEYIRLDLRFRIVCYVPADAETIQQCAVWAQG